jgi:DNA topoisomerase-1
VEQDLKQKEWPKSKILALIIKLMEETHIRIGSEQYAKRNHSYGLTTLRKKHIDIYRDKMKFEFTGKKGKKHSVTVRNKKLVNLVSCCEDIPGWELFQYYDKHGKKQSVDSGLVNEYLHEITGAYFTAKDFRTWGASVLFFDTLMDFGPALEDKEKQQNILKGIDAVAEALGNTRNVSRKYYVHPLLLSTYQNGILDKAFKVAQKKKAGHKYFSPSESAVLQLIEKYRPELS